MIHVGDNLRILPTLPEKSVQCCITSPPYFGLRDYGVVGQHGLEESPDAFITNLVAVFREVRRVLRDDGTLWVNIGDSSAGSWGAEGRTTSVVSTMQQKSVTNHPKRATRKPDGVKRKDLIGIPWMLAFALRADGWYLRQDIIWHKPNPMPESVRDRCTKSHEYLFLLSKSPRYYFDSDAIAEASTGAIAGNTKVSILPGERTGKNANIRGGLVAFAEKQRSTRNTFARETKASPGDHGQKPQHRADREAVAYSGTRNKRSVWCVATQAFKEAHFATFPEALIEPCILAGSRPGDTVLDPYMGAGTTAVVCERLGRRWVGCELNPAYAEMANHRIHHTHPGLPLEATA